MKYRLLFIALILACCWQLSSAQNLGPPGGSSSSGGTTFANPTATAGPAAVNGSATTAMRSDAAPAIQKGTNAQFGIVEGDGTSVTCVTGVCSTVAPAAVSAGFLSPTGTTSSSVVMMGMGVSSCKFTTTSTRARLSFGGLGVITGTVTAGDRIMANYYWGTGSAPINGVAAPGGSTQYAQMLLTTAVAFADYQNASLSLDLTGLPSATAIWFDMGLAVVSTLGTATIVNMGCSGSSF